MNIRTTSVVDVAEMEPEILESRVQIYLQMPDRAIELASFTAEGDGVEAAQAWLRRAFQDKSFPARYPVRVEGLEVA